MGNDMMLTVGFGMALCFPSVESVDFSIKAKINHPTEDPLLGLQEYLDNNYPGNGMVFIEASDHLGTRLIYIIIEESIGTISPSQFYKLNHPEEWRRKIMNFSEPLGSLSIMEWIKLNNSRPIIDSKRKL